MPDNRKRKLATFSEEPNCGDKRRKTLKPTLAQLAPEQTSTLAETLPTELFHIILKQLPPSSVLAVKFTCRAFYAKTLHHNGREIVDLKKIIVHNMPPRKTFHRDFKDKLPPVWQDISAIAALLIDFEMRDAKTLDKLTCSRCARCKPKGPIGFSDMYFAQRRPVRYCNECCYWAGMPPFGPWGALYGVLRTAQSDSAKRRLLVTPPQGDDSENEAEL